MDSSGTKSKIHELLEAAFNGELRRVKKFAAEFDDGRGLAQTLAGVKDNMNQTAIHTAAREGMVNICKFWIGDLKLEVDPRDAKGNTPLHRACEEGHLSTAEYLLKKGADPNTRNERGFTPLHFAAEYGREEVLRLLLSKGANVDALSRGGTPLNMAVSKGKHEAVKILLDHCANPGFYLHHVPTPLYAAVLAKSLRCVELLIAADADPDAVTCGVTPLHLAASEGQTEIIKCLLKAGADPDVTDEDGMRPVEVAALNCSQQDVMVLYPVTSPIPSYPEWSVDGIMKHVRSEDARNERVLKVKENFEETKSKGDDGFRKKDYQTAIYWYTKAMHEEPSNAILLSNRSLCWAHMNRGDLALTDARACRELKPDWPEAYYREGVAWSILEDYDRAADAFSEGLKLDPENKELRAALREACEARLKSISINQGS